MKKKRILFLFVTLFASTLLYSQVVGVKTNLVMDAMKIINLGAEVGLSKKLTLDLYANYNPWKYKDQKMMKMLAIQPPMPSPIIFSLISPLYHSYASGLVKSTIAAGKVVMVTR